MMDFITVPLVTGIVFAAIYALFELFVRRKERLMIIEKLSDRLEASVVDNKFFMPTYAGKRISFNALRIGCLLVGFGLGLLIGTYLAISIADSAGVSVATANNWDGWFHGEFVGVIYGASVLLFGGIGLLAAFLIEMRIGGKDSK